MDRSATLSASALSIRSLAVGRLLPAAARILLGLTFFVCGLNGMLHFLPQPTEPLPASVVAFTSALHATGYMLPLIAATQVLGGALLLLDRCLALGLVLLAPVVVNIVAFHAFLAPAGNTVAWVILALELYLAYTKRDAFRPLFRA